MQRVAVRPAKRRDIQPSRSAAGRTATADGRSIVPASTETVPKRDRRRSFGISPNSRRSRRRPRAATSSHPQDWDRSMSRVTHFVGIDVAKHTLEVAVRPTSQRLSLDYDDAGLQQLLRTLPEPETCLIVLEATGGYQRRVVAELVTAGHLVAVVNPRQVRDFARGHKTLAETDRIDADVIARFGEQVNVRLIPKRAEKTRGTRPTRRPATSTGGTSHLGEESPGDDHFQACEKERSARYRRADQGDHPPGQTAPGVRRKRRRLEPDGPDRQQRAGGGTGRLGDLRIAVSQTTNEERGHEREEEASSLENRGQAADRVGRTGAGRGGLGTVPAGRNQPDALLRLEEDASVERSACLPRSVPEAFREGAATGG